MKKPFRSLIVAMAFLVFSTIFPSANVFAADEDGKQPISMIITQDIKYSNTPTPLTVTITYDDGSTEIKSADSWATSNSRVAYVREDKLYFNGYNGEVTITAFYGSLSASRTANVVRLPTASITDIKIIGDLKYSEDPVQLSVMGYYSDDTSDIISGSISWRSSNSRIATVNSAGLVTFTGENGRVTITARFGSIEDSITITVNNPIPNRIRIVENLRYDDDPVQLTVRAYYDGYDRIVTRGVKWRSDNTRVATVSDSGVVTFRNNVGYVTITAEYMGKTDSETTGSDPKEIEYIYFNGDVKFSTKVQKQLSVIGHRADGRTTTIPSNEVIWNSSNEEILTIDDQGRFTFHGESGRVGIIALYEGKHTTKYVTIDAPDIEELKFARDIPKNADEFQLDLRVVYESPHGTLDLAPVFAEWTSSDDTVAKVSDKGLVTFTGYGGTATITATYNDFKVSTTVEREGLTYEQATRKKVFASNIDTIAVSESIKERKNSTTFRQTPNFSDTQDHWANDDIYMAKRLGIVSGYAYNRFVPAQDITRAEFVTFLANAFNIEGKEGRSKFPDARNHWAEHTINAVNDMGIVNGYDDGTFRPDDKITRSEIAAILARVIDFSQVSRIHDSRFVDTNYHWASVDIKQLADIGVVRGIGNNNFGPNLYASRAETVVMILRTLKLDSEINRHI